MIEVILTGKEVSKIVTCCPRLGLEERVILVWNNVVVFGAECEE